MIVKKMLMVILMAALWMGNSESAPGMGSSSTRPTLLVMPARYTTMQLAFDLLAKRNTVLVAYQNESGGTGPVLHVWDGQEWIPITLDAYRQSSFLRTSPSRVILVGDDATLPTALVGASTTTRSGTVMQIPSQDTATLVNALGKVYKFSDREWAWFSGRYRLELTDANAELRGESFYDQAPLAARPESPWKRPVVRSQRKSQVISSSSTTRTVESMSSLPATEIAPLGTLSVAPMAETMPATIETTVQGTVGGVAPVIWTDEAAPIK